MDVVQGSYQQTEEIQARARLLGHDLSVPQAVVIFELAPDETSYTTSGLHTQWGKRLREELLRTWPNAWVIHEPRRVMTLLPCANTTAPPHDHPLLSTLTRPQ